MNASHCAHPGCTCAVEAQQRFCSDHCEQAASTRSRSDKCDCGHPGCRSH